MGRMDQNAEPDAPVPDWEKRFRAPRVSLPEWAEDAPARSLFISNATGTFELYAWDRATGGQRQVTDRPNGTTDGALTPDGQWIWWFSDTDGDEFGVWMRQPFGGGEDTPAAARPGPLVPGGPGHGPGRHRGRRPLHGRGGLDHPRGAPGSRSAAPVEIYRHTESAGVGDLSHDGSLLVIEHTEHGDAMHSALRVVRSDGSHGRRAGRQRGRHRGAGPDVLGFAPVDGDTRLLVGHQRRGRWEPMIWDPLSGSTTELDLGLPGDVSAEWYPDASALLIVHSHQARDELFRYDLAPASAPASRPRPAR